MATKKKYYGVKTGRETGVFTDWNICKEQVMGFKGAEYKSFSTEADALAYVNGESARRAIFLESDLSPGEYIAYVDGSYDIKDHTYSFGAILIGIDVEEEANRRFAPDEQSDMRNVAGEIEGAKWAMIRAAELGATRLYLHYDYAGIEKWATGEWKRNKKATAEYHDFYGCMKEKLTVKFIKVPAHQGIPGNERADKLAKEALL